MNEKPDRPNRAERLSDGLGIAGAAIVTAGVGILCGLAGALITAGLCCLIFAALIGKEA